jgi:hypothetical protein
MFRTSLLGLLVPARLAAAAMAQTTITPVATRTAWPTLSLRSLPCRSRAGAIRGIPDRKPAWTTEM